MKDAAVKESFKPGDYLVGIGPHKGCSQVFQGAYDDYQPFHYLNDFDPSHFRLATDEEKQAAIEAMRG